MVIPTNGENRDGEKQRKILRRKAPRHFKKHLNFSSNGESGQGKFWGPLPIEKVKKWRSHILSQQHETYHYSIEEESQAITTVQDYTYMNEDYTECYHLVIFWQ